LIAAIVAATVAVTVALIGCCKASNTRHEKTRRLTIMK